VPLPASTTGPPNKSTATRTLPPQRWLLTEPNPGQSASLAHEARLPLVLAELLVARGITTAAEAFAFLNPEPSHLHEPFLMLGMTAAVERLERAIAAREPILLYGDYDVDGTVAVVLLKTAIEMLGGAVNFHVPHRLRDGYGMQSNVLEAAQAEGVRVVVTVDTGMRAFAEAETARRLGLDLIITDHHLPDANEKLPAALAILNPNQAGCAYPEKSLCGAAIALKLAQALLERSCLEKSFLDNSDPARRDPVRLREKTLPSFLKMAAIATIADAVPLHGENRTIAALGLRELRRPAGAGLRALFAAAALDPASKQITGFDVAFRLAPRINAAGRMDVASEIIELFTTRDSNRAAELAAKLERLNRERRDVEAAALTVIESRLCFDSEVIADRLLVIDGDGWHRGVIGILASRVVERTAKPAIVVSVEDGIAYGSGRSVDGFPLLAAIESCADLFTRFGGHAFAVGFALPAEKLPDLKRRLRTYATEHLAAREPERLLRIHAELPLDRITPVLAGWLRKLEPLGHGNPEPIFIARSARLVAPPRIMKAQHLRLELAQDPTPSSTPTSAPPVASSPAAALTPPPNSFPTRLPVSATPVASIRAIGWNLAERAAQLRLVEGSLIDIAYRIRENDHPDFGGLEIEIMGIELAGLQPVNPTPVPHL
jgi:single-stranded-DNA-specific exonuclease